MSSQGPGVSSLVHPVPFVRGSAGRPPGCSAGRPPGCSAGRPPGCSAGRPPGCSAGRPPGCSAGDLQVRGQRDERRMLNLNHPFPELASANFPELASALFFFYRSRCGWGFPRFLLQGEQVIILLGPLYEPFAGFSEAFIF